MANEIEFDFSGIIELSEKFNNACSEYSDICAKIIESKAREFKKELVKNTDDLVKEHTGNLKKGYRFQRTEFDSGEVKKNLKITAKHFHLVEKGHNKVNEKGQRIGWVEGKFFLKKTVEEFPPRMVDGMQQVCKLIVKECNK